MTEEEVEKDLMIPQYLNKQIGKYLNSGKLNSRLLLNQLIIFNNVFGGKAPNILFERIPEERWSILATLLQHLDKLPEEVKVNDTTINTDTVLIDDTILFEITK